MCIPICESGTELFNAANVDWFQPQSISDGH